MHHHFSDDEEEEEDNNEAMIDVQELNILDGDINAIQNNALSEAASPEGVPQNNEPSKQTHLNVIGPDGEDFTQYFDKNFVAVERVLSTTVIFPVIHPR